MQQRLSVIGELGLPQVVLPGCIDFSVFASGSVPGELGDRPTYDHNPEYTLVRTPKDEMAIIGEIFARRLNGASGPVRVIVPTQGLSIPSVPDGVFWDPPADAAFLEALRASLDEAIPVETRALHINDERCGIDDASRTSQSPL